MVGKEAGKWPWRTEVLRRWASSSPGGLLILMGSRCFSAIVVRYCSYMMLLCFDKHVRFSVTVGSTNRADKKTETSEVGV